MNTSLYILDDDLYFGRCLKKALESTVDEVKYFKTERNFIKALTGGPNVVILDYNLEKTTGLAVLDRIKEEGVETEVLLVSSQKDPRIVMKAYKKGVLGYFEKSANTLEQVRKSIEWMLLLSNDFNHPLHRESFQKIWMQGEGRR